MQERVKLFHSRGAELRKYVDQHHVCTTKPYLVQR
jgi:hypothetical protein